MAGEPDPKSEFLGRAETFEAILLEVVDQSSLMLLGKSGRAATYFHIESIFHLPKQEIPQRLEDFSKAVRKIFGVGGQLIEQQILKELCKRLGVNYQWVKGNKFRIAVDKVRKLSSCSVLHDDNPQ